MDSHTINYEGLKYKVFGEYKKTEEETGCKGGFSWLSIKINDVEISYNLKDSFIEKLVELVVEENY